MIIILLTCRTNTRTRWCTMWIWRFVCPFIVPRCDIEKLALRGRKPLGRWPARCWICVESSLWVTWCGVFHSICICKWCNVLSVFFWDAILIVPLESNSCWGPFCPMVSSRTQYLALELTKQDSYQIFLNFCWPFAKWNNCVAFRRTLGVIHRILCFEKKCRVRLQYPWRDLWNCLAALVKFVVHNEGNFKGPCDIFQLCQQVLHFSQRKNSLFFYILDSFSRWSIYWICSSPLAIHSFQIRAATMNYITNWFAMGTHLRICTQWVTFVMLFLIFYSYFRIRLISGLRITASDGEQKSAAVKLCNNMVNIRWEFVTFSSYLK